MKKLIKVYIAIATFSGIILLILIITFTNKNSGSKNESANKQNVQVTDAQKAASSNTQILTNLDAKLAINSDGFQIVKVTNNGNTDWHNCTFKPSEFFQLQVPLIPKHTGYDLEADNFKPTDAGRALALGLLDEGSLKMAIQLQGIAVSCDEGITTITSNK